MPKTDLALIDDALNSVRRLKEQAKRRVPLTESQRAAMSLLCKPPNSPGHRVFPSMAAAAAALKVPKATLKKLKNDGCPAFVSTRVKEDLILPWLQAREAMAKDGLEDDKDSLERRFLMVRIERQQLAFRKEAESVYEKREVEEFLLDAINRIKTILREKLKNELPPKLEGLRAPEIAARMDEIIPVVCDKLKWMHEDEPGTN